MLMPKNTLAAAIEIKEAAANIHNEISKAFLRESFIYNSDKTFSFHVDFTISRNKFWFMNANRIK